MKEIDRLNLETTSQGEERANVIYYFHNGAGNWVGTFRFTITNWKGFWSDRIGAKNRLLVLGMFVLVRLFGVGKMTSRIEGFPYRLNGEKEHPAEILEAGMCGVYYIPLLGTEWRERDVVQSDRYHLESHITCTWGEAQESIQWVV